MNNKIQILLKIKKIIKDLEDEIEKDGLEILEHIEIRTTDNLDWEKIKIEITKYK